MNIQSVQGFDAAMAQLGAIKGDVTQEQLNGLTELFSMKIWNTSDTEGTKATLDRQISEMQQLLDEIQAQIDELYNQQKTANEEMNGLVNDLNNESYQASKQADKNIKEQQDLVSAATDEAYNKYMKGEIEKEEIPMYIASTLKKSNPSAGAQLESHLAKMDAMGASITSVSNKIANMLDSINEFKAKYETTETSMNLLQQLKTQIKDHNPRADIQQTLERPYFSPSQEALGDKVIDAFRTVNDGKWADGNEGTALMKDALTGSGTVVDEARKQELDAMTPEAKAAAVEEADFSKYSVPELFYLSGMDVTQAAYALGEVFRGAGIGYNEQNGNLIVPFGHDATAGTYRELEKQFQTLWGGNVERGSETEAGKKGSADPIGWREGDTNFLFTIDRNKDGIFNGPEEFVGAQNGWQEMVTADANNDKILTADEMAEAGFSVMENNQALTNGGTYGWNGVKESGVESIDLSSYTEMDAIKSTNLNGNTRKAEFNMTVNGEVTLGKQTENNEAYNEAFYSHTYNEAYAFGLNPDEVEAALKAAARPEDYTAVEKIKNEALAAEAEATIEDDADNLTAKTETLNGIVANAGSGSTLGVKDRAENEEETATNTTDNTADNSAGNPVDDYIPEE